MTLHPTNNHSEGKIGRALDSNTVSDAVEEVQAIDDEEADVPEEVESILEELFKTVQDKVRQASRI